MNIKRDKFLTEAMGECWHVGAPNFCVKCKDAFEFGTFQNNFSTPDGFFKLWKWAQEQEWWENFRMLTFTGATWIGHEDRFINPDRFADAVYAFLKEQ
jgi:hypothetical protein